MLGLRQEPEENTASAEAWANDTTLYVELAGGAKSRSLYGVGWKGVDYFINSGNKWTAIFKPDGGWEKKSIRMKRKLTRKINKLNQTL